VESRETALTALLTLDVTRNDADGVRHTDVSEFAPGAEPVDRRGADPELRCHLAHRQEALMRSELDALRL